MTHPPDAISPLRLKTISENQRDLREIYVLFPADLADLRR